MEKIVLNQYQLTDNDVDHFANRVKALIVNDSNQIMMCRSNGSLSFIGGHVENNESLNECLQREVLEETGISIRDNQTEPILQLIKYDKNYFSTNQSAKSTITYFAVKTNKRPLLFRQRLDDKEKQGSFQIQFFDLDDIEKILISDAGFAQKPELYEEMLYVINHYKTHQKNSQSKEMAQQV